MSIQSHRVGAGQEGVIIHTSSIRHGTEEGVAVRGAWDLTGGCVLVGVGQVGYKYCQILSNSVQHLTSL